MKIYNSLTRKIEDLEPLNPPQINMYTCGVTVYDECHIGHARSLYTFDVIRRYLEYRGFKVNFVRNITDIDDKIINRANELEIDWKKLVDEYIESYREDLELLGVRPGIVDKNGEEPRATKNIEDIKKYIKALIDKGYAYVTATGVYFSVRKFKEYGKLSGQSIDQMMVGVRKGSDETKADPLDFALWKVSKPGEPSWPSPWKDGRPGWHIECSVMSTKYLKTDTLDIHAGGLDLIFPHHENEIAQSQAKSGKQFAKYWIHHGLLTINGQKMSKSLGNFITIKDFIVKYKDADLLKLLLLNTHYRHPVDYTGEKIEEMRKQKKTFDDFFDKVNHWQIIKDGKQKTVTTDNDRALIDKMRVMFEDAMDGDFNTPQALAVLFKLVDISSDFITADKEDAFGKVKSLLEMCFKVFGLKVKPAQSFPPEAMKKLKEREKAREDRDFHKADTIRKEIEIKFNGVLADTNSGITFIEK